MLIIYHSNKADVFKNLLISTISKKLLSDPMQSEIILTENGSIGKWIQIELANYFGIACNIDFMTITSFIQNILNKTTSNNYISYFSHATMYWKFVEILSNTQIMENFSIIDKYLCNDFEQRKVGQLSEQLATLFTQYLIYRPDWLYSWQCNKKIDYLDDISQNWQSTIWRMFLKNILNNENQSNNDVNPFQICIRVLKTFRNINYDFPNRIFIFGMTSISPVYWQILILLSYHIDIYLWCINPFMYNWIRIFKSDSNVTCIKTLQGNQFDSVQNDVPYLPKYFTDHHYADCTNSTDYLIHPLLKSWGNVGYNTVSLLNNFKDKFKLKSFVIFKKDSLLNIIQKDIFKCYGYLSHKSSIQNSTDRTCQFSKRNILKPEDRSITCHVCHSIQREVEVLHDNLLSMMTDDPFLSPRDIVVMAPDISCYVSAIKTVFNMQNRSLPFIITSYHNKNIHPIILTFLKILNISSSRFISEEILSFLTVSAIASRFNIDREELKLLRYWIVGSGIRWGLDDITMQNLNLPIVNQNTWYSGLMRMLLGYAIKDKYVTWENIFPYSNITAEHTHLIGQLGEFLKILKKWRDRFHQSYTLKEWILYCQEIITDFFYSDNTETADNKVLFFLRDCCLNILSAGIQAGYTRAISVTVLRDKLRSKLIGNITTTHRFLPNVINFCNITPIYYLPCKIMCFLGMNCNIFPRHQIMPSFNLIYKNPRKNDDNIYEKDCYAFLLAFLLAQDRIYISFIGSSIYDSTVTNYPSVLIDELFEYIAQNFYFIEHKHVDISVNIKYIRQHLYKWYDPFPFSPKNFNSNANTQSFADEWLCAANKKMSTSLTTSTYFNTLLSYHDTKIITFQNLYDFYRHPIRFWFQKRLNVYFYQKILRLLHDEPFLIDGLDCYKLNVKLINYLIHNKNINKLYNSVVASGILPRGAFGELYWMNQYEKMTTLANQIRTHHCCENYNLDIYLQFDTIKLIGELAMVQKNGLIRWVPKHLSMRDILLLWLEHVIYCSVNERGDSWLFGVNEVWHLPNFPSLQAKKFLQILILGYCTGMNAPMFLLYQSGGAWINHVFDWSTRTISLNTHCQKKARKKLIQAWNGTEYSFYRECQDPYLRKLIPYDLDEKNITEITKTAEHYYFNVMKYRII